MVEQVTIAPFIDKDATAVKDLFIGINRLLAPPALEDVFETYIGNSINEEIGRVADYYAEKRGSFWTAKINDHLVGMFGLEPSGEIAMELRRMYVAADWRRRGIAGTMLTFAENQCRTVNKTRLDLSTSELQPAALSFYRRAGYQLIREQVAETISNKTIGAGIRRYYFVKILN